MKQGLSRIVCTLLFLARCVTGARDPATSPAKAPELKIKTDFSRPRWVA